MSKGNAAVERILNGSRSIWESFHEHPFVRGIADGILPVEKFRYYMLQDYVYILDYAKVFSIGAAKAAPTRADLPRSALQFFPARSAMKRSAVRW